jgi:hypothetical protein
MVQASKFSGALSRLREVPAAPEEPAEAPAPPQPPAAPVVATPAAKGRGRPAGKRSDPEFKPTTLLLREKTKRAAMRLLEDKGGGQDLSELVEQLLAQWSKRQG